MVTTWVVKYVEVEQPRFLQSRLLVVVTFGVGVVEGDTGIAAVGRLVIELVLELELGSPSLVGAEAVAEEELEGGDGVRVG
jgi:hypothetical protein